jgi:hypothetical protein
VEYLNSLLVYHIIHDLKQPSAVINTQKQMFVQDFVPNVIIEGILTRLQNAFFTNPVVKCGLGETDNNIHTITLPHPRAKTSPQKNKQTAAALDGLSQREMP